jgi:hypothetical protein
MLNEISLVHQVHCNSSIWLLCVLGVLYEVQDLGVGWCETSLLVCVLVLTPSTFDPPEATMSSSSDQGYNRHSLMSIQSSSSPLLFSQQSQHLRVVIFSILPLSS